MNPDYSQRQYYKVTQIIMRKETIDNLLAELHAEHEKMIEQALEQSDMQQARDVINWIKERL
jgi:DNA-binding MurR/RpiR family transcriptional regulator